MSNGTSAVSTNAAGLSGVDLWHTVTVAGHTGVLTSITHKAAKDAGVPVVCAVELTVEGDMLAVSPGATVVVGR